MLCKIIFDHVNISLRNRLGEVWVTSLTKQIVAKQSEKCKRGFEIESQCCQRGREEQSGAQDRQSRPGSSLRGEMVSETSTEENCNCPAKDCAQWEPETNLGKIKILDHHHQT